MKKYVFIGTHVDGTTDNIKKISSDFCNPMSYCHSKNHFIKNKKNFEKDFRLQEYSPGLLLQLQPPVNIHLSQLGYIQVSEDDCFFNKSFSTGI
jgi:hypothetical protein